MEMDYNFLDMNYPLYIGIRYDQSPYPILFKKMEGSFATKETLISKGKVCTKNVFQSTYFGIFDNDAKPIMVCDFENGELCGELSLDDLEYIIL